MGRLSNVLEKSQQQRCYRFISVLDKMIAIDLIKAVGAILSVIVIIIVSRKFIKVLAKAVDGTIANDTVLNLLGLNTIIAMSEFLPASIFMAILMVLGRMYRDQEMPAVASAGGGVFIIYRAVFLCVFPLSIIATALALVASPWAESSIQKLIHHDKKVADIRGISAGRFSEYNHGDMVFYTESIDKNKHMSHIFIQHKGQHKTAIITADQGHMENLEGGLYLILEQGERVQGIAGEKNFIIEKFTQYAVLIEAKESHFYIKRYATPTATLWNSYIVKDIAELQSRLSIPLAVIFLSILAVPLAKLSPRGGVYGSLLMAFAIYFIYGNLKRISHSWVVNGTISITSGYVAIYLILLILTAVLLVRLYGSAWFLLKLKGQVKP